VTVDIELTITNEREMLRQQLLSCKCDPFDKCESCTEALAKYIPFQRQAPHHMKD
jgi:hypothetical protein